MWKIAGVVAGMGVLSAFAQSKADENKPLTYAQLLSSLTKVSSYQFSIQNSPDDISGTFEKGSFHYMGQNVQVGGKGSVTHSAVDGKWMPHGYYVSERMGGQTLLRLARIQPAHMIVARVAGSIQNLKGDAASGFTGDLARPFLTELVKEPWINRTDLPSSSTLRGTVKITVSNGMISKLELHVSGRVVEATNQGGQPMVGAGGRPIPGGGNQYNLTEKDVSLTYEITIGGTNTAKVADGVKKVIGF